jgi:pimeloyl-ACP methyl ester carboxylesterase
MAEDVLRYADQRKLSTFTLLGHSMGGKIAMALATLQPQRIEGLVIVDAPPKNAQKDVGYISNSVAAVSVCVTGSSRNSVGSSISRASRDLKRWRD